MQQSGSFYLLVYSLFQFGLLKLNSRHKQAALLLRRDLIAGERRPNLAAVRAADMSPFHLGVFAEGFSLLLYFWNPLLFIHSKQSSGLTLVCAVSLFSASGMTLTEFIVS